MPIPSLEPVTSTNTLKILLSKGDIWLGSTPENTFIRPQVQDRLVTSFGIDEIDSALPQGGLPTGTLNEFFSSSIEGFTELPLTIPSILTRRIIEQCNRAHRSAWNNKEKSSLTSEVRHSSPFSFVWIGKRCWPTPFLLEKNSLSQCIFIDPPSPELFLWSIETALRSPSVMSVIADCPTISLTTFRKLQFAARSSGATALLLRNEKDADNPSCAYSQWRVTPSPSSQELPAWELSLIKVKGGTPTRPSWIVCAESCYEQGEKISIGILPKLVDRCDETVTSEEGSRRIERYYGT